MIQQATGPQKRIINEPLSEIRTAARAAMRGRMGLLIASVALFSLCLSIPVTIVEEITGFWSILDIATHEYVEIVFGSMPSVDYAAINDWAQYYSDKMMPSLATFIFLLIVPGPLELGISTIWLQVLRGKEAYADMVFSGFGSFLHALLLHLFRCVFIVLWSLLLLIPGIIAMYRYSLAFFLLADNPGMPPLTALTYSKYYMQENKGNRFVLDLTFLGWALLGYILMMLIEPSILSVIVSSGYDPGLFVQFLVSSILSAIIYSPIIAYRGIASAEYYHRVICRAPHSFT